MPDRFYPKTEKYNVGDRVQALLLEVKDTDNGGAEVILSRSHPEFVAQLFKMEVPELNDGTITIQKIVREAGYRTKLAVTSSDPKIDPVGACVGVRGARVKNIIRELNNEKIDIMPYSDDPLQLLQNALAPVEIKKYNMDKEHKTLTLIVDDESYPTVLGKRGQNARLNGELIEMDIHIQKMSEYKNVMNAQLSQLAASDDASLDEALVLEGISSLIVENLLSAGFDTPRKVLHSSVEQLATVPGVSIELADRILDQIRKKRM
jgi:N utilization substance protein A